MDINYCFYSGLPSPLAYLEMNADEESCVAVKHADAGTNSGVNKQKRSASRYDIPRLAFKAGYLKKMEPYLQRLHGYQNGLSNLLIGRGTKRGKQKLRLKRNRFYRPFNK